MSFGTVEGENGSNIAENCNYELLFDDKTSVIVDSKICDGKMLCVGDEVFIYDEVNLISRTPLSPQELKKMIRRTKIGYTIVILVSLLAGIAAALAF